MHLTAPFIDQLSVKQPEIHLPILKCSLVQLSVAEEQKERKKDKLSHFKNMMSAGDWSDCLLQIQDLRVGLEGPFLDLVFFQLCASCLLLSLALFGRY